MSKTTRTIKITEKITVRVNSSGFKAELQKLHSEGWRVLFSGPCRKAGNELDLQRIKIIAERPYLPPNQKIEILKDRVIPFIDTKWTLDKGPTSSSEFQTFSIWSEGSWVMEGKAHAHNWGSRDGRTFKEACERLAAYEAGFGLQFDPERMTWWGCKLFDNEVAARAAFG